MKKIITVFIYLISVILGLSLVVGALSSMNLNLPYQTYLVQSGSMEPSIMTGDVVVIKKTHQIKQNDVITFVDDQQRLVTHRVIEDKTQGKLPLFKTKGDANRTADLSLVKPNQIKGKVWLTIPKLGYVVRFSKTKLGIVLLIMVPATIIVYEESQQLFQEITS